MSRPIRSVPAPTPEPKPGLTLNREIVALVFIVLGIAGGTSGAAVLWGLGGALLVGGIASLGFGVLLGIGK